MRILALVRGKMEKLLDKLFKLEV